MLPGLLLVRHRRHDRQVVDVDMAGEAAGEFIVDHLLVRLAMAVGTLGYVAVAVLVAGDAGDRPMFARVLRQ